MGLQALKESCFLTGSLLLEQREKLGRNFMSSTTAFALRVRGQPSALASERERREAEPHKGFQCERPGGSRFPAFPFSLEEEGEKPVLFAADCLF